MTVSNHGYMRHNPHTHVENFFLSYFEPIFASNSKTAHFERKRWAPPFKPCPRGVHWWWSRPNWLSWHREKWIGPSKNGNLGPLWMETKNLFLGLRKENATLAWSLPFCHFFLDQNGAKLSSSGDFHYIWTVQKPSTWVCGLCCQLLGSSDVRLKGLDREALLRQLTDL